MSLIDRGHIADLEATSYGGSISLRYFGASAFAFAARSARAASSSGGGGAVRL